MKRLRNWAPVGGEFTIALRLASARPVYVLKTITLRLW